MALTRATLVWCLVGTMAAMTIASFALTGLSLDLCSNPWLPLAIAGLMSASVFYRYRRPNPHLCAVTEAAAQMLLILLFGILLTYAAMTTNLPYRDAELFAIDRVLGLDRRAYLDFVNSRPLLAELAGYAYLSLLPQFALVPMVLMIANQLPHLRRWMIAFGLAPDRNLRHLGLRAGSCSFRLSRSDAAGLCEYQLHCLHPCADARRPAGGHIPLHSSRQSRGIDHLSELPHRRRAHVHLGPAHGPLCEVAGDHAERCVDRSDTCRWCALFHRPRWWRGRGVCSHRCEPLVVPGCARR